MQNRGIAVCLVPPNLRLDATSERTEGLQLWMIPLSAPARDPLTESWIGQDDVVLRKGRWLVGDLVGAHLREAMRELPPAAVPAVRGFQHSGACACHNYPLQTAGWTPLPRIRYCLQARTAAQLPP